MGACAPLCQPILTEQINTLEHEAVPGNTHILRGCLFIAFCHFFISFQKIKKIDDPKSEKLEAHFHEFLSFSLLGTSNFLISRKPIHKSDEKLKQTPPQKHGKPILIQFLSIMLTAQLRFNLASSILMMQQKEKIPLNAELCFLRIADET
jgi:hypothetical protein